jgi:hypothetical protein
MREPAGFGGLSHPRDQLAEAARRSDGKRSAIWTAFSAAPWRRLAHDTKNDNRAQTSSSGWPRAPAGGRERVGCINSARLVERADLQAKTEFMHPTGLSRVMVTLS